MFLILIYAICQENIYITDKQENMTSLSNEAIQAIGTVYNSGKVSVNNVTAENTISGNTLNVNTIAGVGANGIVKFTGNVSTEESVTIGGKICTGSVCLSQNEFQRMLKFWTLKDRMYDENAIIYDNIFTAQSSGVISKSGSPTGWDNTSYATTLWNGKNALDIGENNQYPNGLAVTVPTGMTVIWVRIWNDRWAAIQLYDSDGTNLGIFASGFRNLNNIDPNGNAPDAGWTTNKWMPMPVPKGGKYTLVGGNPGNGGNWISGIAFSTNPWNHAMNSAIAYFWNLNAGGSNVTWNNQNWNNDQIAQINNGETPTVLMVPVVPSGNDKLVYIIEYNNNWVGTQHTSVTANGTAIERFKTTYSNPFATHNNSKQYCRYIAARIPSNLIKPTDTFVTLSINMSDNDNIIFFREIGTHDYL